jgi:hypothetical protein
MIDTLTRRSTVIARGWVQGVSFAPTAPDRLVYGLARTTPQGTAGSINPYSAAANGGPPTQLTHDGVSLYPVWGKRGIVFDKETLGRPGGVPGYQLYQLSAGRVTRITHMKVYWLNEGLVPAAVSADGTRLAANLLGEAGNAPQAWSVNLVTHAVHNLGTWLVAQSRVAAAPELAATRRPLSPGEAEAADRGR